MKPASRLQRPRASSAWPTACFVEKESTSWLINLLFASSSTTDLAGVLCSWQRWYGQNPARTVSLAKETWLRSHQEETGSGSDLAKPVLV
ncbi:unnamed protein product [Protopolystoma xenopodis]|uniref:Uncharacterized protein n=1 Tax=Protopolystoma xenopodis TaxID=117903 RepID=A0A448XJ88_9PLAT|nr:unnamed protein product [Protopolystoma xenopodis]